MPHYVPEDSPKSPRFTGPSAFARLPYVRTLEDVDVAVVGVPFDTGVLSLIALRRASQGRAA